MDFEYNEHQVTWLEALESGEYNQCVGALWRIDDDGKKGYCCLGVATELLDSESSFMWSRAYDSKASYGCSAPKSVVAKLKLRSSEGSTKNSDKYEELIGLNDNFKLSFKEIASHIRSNPREYFTNEEDAIQ